MEARNDLIDQAVVIFASDTIISLQTILHKVIDN